MMRRNIIHLLLSKSGGLYLAMTSSPHMDNGQVGAELNQASKVLFDAAANNWYWAAFIELIAGLAAMLLGFIDLPADWVIMSALLVTVLLISAYALRLSFEDRYDRAE